MTGHGLDGELSRFLAEDVRTGDITSSLLPKKPVHAKIVSRQHGIAAGVRLARKIFALRECRASAKIKDGGLMVPGQTIMTIRGAIQDVLACERTALNLLSRMSGIATQTGALAEMLPPGTRLFATRKTAPGLRAFDKEAVRIGGGQKHRMGLDDMVMFKDNHLAAGLTIEELVRCAKQAGHHRVEVEVETKADAITAARSGATIVMLDNFTPRQVSKTVDELRRLGLRDGVVLEASGRITGRNIARYARTGIEMISVGSITNSVSGIDLSLEI